MTSVYASRLRDSETSASVLFREPLYDSVVLSPDGMRIAYVYSPSEKDEISFAGVYVRDFETGMEIRISEDKPDRIVWKGNDRIVFVRTVFGLSKISKDWITTVRKTEDIPKGVPHVFLFELNSELHFKQDKQNNDKNRSILRYVTSRDLTPFENVSATIVDPVEEREDRIIVALEGMAVGLNVYRCDIETGALLEVGKGTPETIDWFADRSGNVRLRMDRSFDGMKRRLFYRKVEEEPFRLLAETEFDEAFEPLFFDSDDQSIYVASSRGDREFAGAYLYDPDTDKHGQTSNIVFEHPEADVQNLKWSKKHKSPMAAICVTGRREVLFSDHCSGRSKRISEAVREGKIFYERLMSFFPNHEVMIVSSSDDARRHIVFVHDARSRGIYYLYDSEINAFRKLLDRSPWLSPEHMVPMHRVAFKTRDGTIIRGFLMVPNGTDLSGLFSCDGYAMQDEMTQNGTNDKKVESSRNLPAVIMVHEGLFDRTFWRFSPEGQFLAARGAAVLYVDYRGSGTYGKTFVRAGYGEWSGAMRSDIEDAARWLTDIGVADRDRIAIYGKGMGGYIALSSVASSSNPFACIVLRGASTNIERMTRRLLQNDPGDRRVRLIFGLDDEKGEKKEKINEPEIKNVSVPILIAHGTEDKKINIEESINAVDEIHRLKRDFVWLPQEGEGHEMKNPYYRNQFYTEMEKILERTIGTRSFSKIDG